MAIPISIIIADDHHLVRQGIRALLEKAGDMKVVGEADDGQKALELVEKIVPDVLVIDISMPRLNGIQALERLRTLRLPTRAIVLSMYSEESFVRQAFQHGAHGYLLKRSLSDELLLAVRAASQGGIYLSPAVSATVLVDFLATKSDTQELSPFEQLSAREREVLKLAAEGHTNQAMAEMLGISGKTIEKHRANLMAKLNVRDITGLVRTAIKYGLITLDE